MSKVLDELEAAEQAATPGPWEARPTPQGPHTENWREIVAGRRSVVCTDAFQRHRGGETETYSGVRISAADAAFITTARNNLPALLRAARAVKRYHQAHIDGDNPTIERALWELFDASDALDEETT